MITLESPFSTDDSSGVAMCGRELAVPLLGKDKGQEAEGGLSPGQTIPGFWRVSGASCIGCPGRESVVSSDDAKSL